MESVASMLQELFMRTPTFFMQMTMLVLVGAILIGLMSAYGVGEGYNSWPIACCALAFWLVQGTTVVHEDATDAIASVLVLKRIGAGLFWLMPAAFAVGFF